jgi:DNA-binding transcriptional ArsR family regulator
VIEDEGHLDELDEDGGGGEGTASPEPDAIDGGFGRVYVAALPALAALPTASAVAVYLAIACYASKRSGYRPAFPGVARIATRTKLSRATVFRALSVLEGAGLLTRARGGDRRTNTYRLRVSPP